jgi:ectoine hydroxylase-related dioxygenase (phytanoyl-CoA dioxygenase family)
MPAVAITAPITTAEALWELGVRPDTLSDAEKDALDRDGFVVLYDMVALDHVAAMRAEMERRFVIEKTAQPGMSDECVNMQDHSPIFDVCLTHPRLLAAIAHVLKENFKAQGVRSRPNPPGKGRQVMHADWAGPPARPGEYFVCNSIWPFVDFTDLNGATRVVPTSHRCGKHPADEMSDACAPHPREIKLEIPAGSVAVFNAHLWHGATLNRSQADRPNVTSYWQRTDLRHRPYAKNPFAPDALARFSSVARYLFD